MKRKFLILIIILLLVILGDMSMVLYNTLHVSVSFDKAELQKFGYNSNDVRIKMTNSIGILIEESKPKIVYDGMTLEELSNQLNKSLHSTMSGKGELIASYSLEHNVDPVMATAIMLQETGCEWECSSLVKNCNNVGGQKGSGCGSYSAFPSLDGGIMAFIDNLERNYINYGLYTPEQINPKYAADPNWSVNVNRYMNKIRTR